MASAAGTQGRRWMLTLQINPDWDAGALMELLSDDPLCKGYVYQLEEAPETGQLHYQGYFEYKNPVRLAHLRGFCPQGHFELARGTRQQCIEYCTKASGSVSAFATYGGTQLFAGAVMFHAHAPTRLAYFRRPLYTTDVLSHQDEFGGVDGGDETIPPSPPRKRRPLLMPPSPVVLVPDTPVCPECGSTACTRVKMESDVED